MSERLQAGPIRILIVEDCAADAELIERQLHSDGVVFVARRVEDRVSLAKELSDFAPNVVLADFRLPSLDGNDVVDMVREQSPNIPVIIVSGAIGEHIAVDVLKRGAADYVMKDNLIRLSVGVRRALAEGEEHSQRLKAEAALKESERRFRALIEKGAELTTIVDGRGVVTYESPNSKYLLGYERGIMLGRNVFELVHPDDVAGARRIFAELLKEPRAIRMLEARIRAQDGSWRWLATVGSNLLADSAVGGVVLNSRDITERREAQEALRQINATLEERVDERTAALRESEARFRTIFDAAADGMFLNEAKTGRFFLANKAFLDMLGYTLEEFLALRLGALHRREDLPLVRAEIATCRRGGAAGRAEVCFRRKDGSLVPTEVSLTRVRLGGKDYALVVVHDITARKKAEESLARANRALRTITACDDVILHASTEMELFQGVCRTVVEVGGYRLSWVGLAENDAQRTVRPVAHAGFTDQFLDGLRVSWGSCFRGRGPVATAIRTGKLALNRDATRCIAYQPFQRFLRKHGCIATLGLPLAADGQCIGALGIFASEESAFDPSEVDLLTRLANNVGYGVQALRARAARKRLERQVLEISEREQRRIGQDVHDGVGQRIAAAKLMCEAAIRRLAKEGSPLVEHACQVENELSGALEDARRVARGLHPVHPGAEALMAALRSLAEGVGRTGGIRCRFVCRRPVLLDDHLVATHLYRIAQEAVNNAVRHSGARRIRIVLEDRDVTVRLAVKDDGCGLPDAAGRGTGLGLSIMRHRASVIGAAITVGSRRGAGTTVVCEWHRLPEESHGG